MSNTDTLRAQVIPFGQVKLLLPNSAVAEVTRLTSEVDAGASECEWLYGMIEWRGLTLPLISIEGLLGLPITPIEQAPRLIVLNTLSPDSNNAFIATAATNNPHLIKLQQEAIDEALQGEHDSHYIYCDYSLEGEKVLVPDLLAIEESLEKIHTTG